VEAVNLQAVTLVAVDRVAYAMEAEILFIG